MAVEQLIDEIASLITENQSKTKPYDTSAEVTRIEGTTVWVHIPGGIEETPVEKTIDCKPGDIVQIRVGGGTAWLTGNKTAPPTDDAVAKVARNEAAVAQESANEAKTVAGEASDAADSIAQHFWMQEEGTDNGAHITEVTQNEWNDSNSDKYHSGGNLLARSNGIVVRKGMKELAKMTADGFDAKTYDSNDNEIIIAHLGYGEGNGDLEKKDAPYYTFGKRSISGEIGNYSTAEGYNTEASGYVSHSEGVDTIAYGQGSHAEGSHALASGNYAHAEGYGVYAIGYQSHAEGRLTEARAQGSHAEGYRSYASGLWSHAQNNHTVATEADQTVIGRYNSATVSGSGTQDDPYVYTDVGNYPFIIGNGINEDTYDRSNALTVDWDGNATLAGDITVENHSSAIGSYLSVGGTHNSFGTYGSVGTPQLIDSASSDKAELHLDAGVWIVNASVRFAYNNTGVRYCVFKYRNDGASADTTINGSEVTVPAIAQTDWYTRMQTNWILPTSGTTIKLFAAQTSGSTITKVTWYLRAVRIR